MTNQLNLHPLTACLQNRKLARIVSLPLSFYLCFSLCPGLAFCHLHPSELLISDCCIRFQVPECFVECHHSRHRDQGQRQAGYPDWPAEPGGDSSWWPALCRQSWCHGEDRHQVWRESHTHSHLDQSVWADICSRSIDAGSALTAFVKSAFSLPASWNYVVIMSHKVLCVCVFYS